MLIKFQKNSSFKQVLILIILLISIIIIGIYLLNRNSQDKQIISGLPLQINKSGSYHLTSDLKITDSNENAIEIFADDVNIDLDGHTITGLIGEKAKNVGISAKGKKGIYIHNGTIEGFAWGVNVYSDLFESENHSQNALKSDVFIENLTIKKSTIRGVKAVGSYIVIKNCIIQDIGGLSSAIANNKNSIGIYTEGEACLIQNNAILNVMPFGVLEGVAIATISPQNNCLITDNYISNSKRPAEGRTFAFWPDYISGNAIFKNNYVYNTTYAYWPRFPANGVIVKSYGNFVDNKFVKIDCSPRNLSHYYDLDLMENKNEWVDEQEKCSDSAEFFIKKSFTGDGRSQYRLADIYYNNLENINQAEDKNFYHYRLFLAAKLYNEAMKNGLTGSEKVVAGVYRDLILNNLKKTIQ